MLKLLLFSLAESAECARDEPPAHRPISARGELHMTSLLLRDVACSAVASRRNGSKVGLGSGPNRYFPKRTVKWFNY